ncbi:MAG TPA: phosphopantothenate/pantothenate synthetase [Nitrosopumilaceae archaeon]|nr:phosphopantothenate/pantothenate synthetase [Nitrosopumilaceae archaeon]
MSLIPKSHPRARSLYIREKLVHGFENGLVAKEGLMAHGRGEAFDYLLGEKTSKPAQAAIHAAAFLLSNATYPVISVNGNVAALCPREIVKLANTVNAKIEVNLFYTNEKRKKNIVNALRKAGAKEILGIDSKASKKISGLDSARRIVDKNGIFKADVVVVPLEDGDRTIALKKAGKKIITFDLNPLSRTAKTADITIVDNVVRAINKLILECKSKNIRKVSFNNKKNLKASVLEIKKNLSRRLPHA